MYLVIFEDGTINQTMTVSDDDLTSCDDGILDIIRFNSDTELAEIYTDGDWLEVDEL